MLVTLDRAIPAGPWDARVILRSGLTEREATATVTFPDAAASSASPVATGAAGARGGTESRWPLAATGLAALGGMHLLASRLRRRRDVVPA